ncbi:hypothetical protein [uncultured Chryseobacterium sp.]|uniref:hypothetical protein n=1 Tax=uncultured Chryseobacterium sp. TaxID=259322 RepID=UPI0025EDE58D|nr:hypothetical protein [uncultured Chryseobacterium sp.]
MKYLKRISRSEMKNIHAEKCMEESYHWCCCNFNGCSIPIYGNDKDLFCIGAGTRLEKC